MYACTYTRTESTTALVANCPCPVVNCPCRTRCALLYTALSLVCLAVTSAGRLPKSAPPRSSRSAAAHPVEVRMSTRCRAASKRDMHAGIVRTCSAGTPIRAIFLKLLCLRTPARSGRGDVTAAYQVSRKPGQAQTVDTLSARQDARPPRLMIAPPKLCAHAHSINSCSHRY